MTVSSPLTIRLLEADPDLADRLSAGARTEATRLTLVQVVSLQSGELHVSALQGENAALRGLLVLRGLLARTIRIGDVVSLQLLGPGDLVEVAGDPLGGQLVPMEMRWTVLEPIQAAAIDDDFLHRTLRWPALAAALFERVSAQAARSSARCAISQLSRVEDRIEALLWFLAERFGRVTGEGVALPLRLTHETIGQMIGAKRPTISLALKTLEGEQAVERRADGAWLLRRPAVPLPALEERPSGGVRWTRASRPAPGEAAREPDAVAHVRTALELELARRMEQERGQLAAEEMTIRIDRARRLHDRTRLRVAAVLRDSAVVRASSSDLRLRVRRTRDRAPGAPDHAPEPVAAGTRDA